MNKLNTQKGFVIPLIIAIVAIVAILVAGGVYVAVKHHETAPANAGTAAATTSQTTNINVTASNSSWKTYMNSQYGFSIQYPSDWAIESTGDLTILKLVASADENTVGTDKPANRIIVTEQADCKDSAWDGSTGFGDFMTRCVTGSGRSFSIVLGAKSGSAEILETQILSTLKFNPAQALSQPGSAQKTYTNSQYGFSLQYPADLIDSSLEARSYYDYIADKNFNVVKRLVISGSQDSGTGPSISGLIQVSVGGSNTAVYGCLSSTPSDASNITQSSINGSQFVSYDLSRSGAGNRFGERVFGILKNNVCYRIEIIESGIAFSVGPNVNQQTASSEAKSYDFPFSAYDVFARLMPVMQTFKFTN